MTFSITCWIFGDEPQTVFDVEIHDEDKDIKSLKALIKEVRAPRLDDVSSPDLELRQVDIPSEDIEQLRKWRPMSGPLLPFQKLKIFKTGHKDHVHLIVNKPGMSQLSLF
jgi:hypothetical protein